MNSRSLFYLLLRISPRNMIILIFALSAGLTWWFATELERRAAANKPVVSEVPQQKQKTTVVVCTRDLAEGGTLTENDVATRVVDMDRAPIDVLTSCDAASGRKLKFGMTAGTLITAHDLAPMNLGQEGFQSKLHPGERAITLAVDSTTGVAGFVAPDSHVDVMVQVGSGASTQTRAILSDVRVVASGTTYQKNPRDGEAIPTSTVTVAVQPREAAKLCDAMAAGKLYLTLRSDIDRTPIAVSDISSLFKPKQVEKPITTIAQVPALAPPPAPILRVDAPDQPTQNPIHEVEIFAGSHRDLTSVRKEL